MALGVDARVAFALIGMVLLLTAVGPAFAADSDANLPLPRFVSLHADKVNLRTGPGDRYPIDWVLTRKDMPVEIFGQSEHWRRIRDWEGTEGWVHQRMLSGKRAVIVKGGVRALYRQPDAGAAVVARAEPGVVAKLLECRGAWCRVEAGDYTGWIKRSDVWGVYPEESVP
jgi:SH3-like domain-containing protein